MTLLAEHKQRLYNHIRQEALGEEGVALNHVRSIVENLMDYKDGRRVITDSLGEGLEEDAMDSLHLRYVLLCSLVEGLPEDTHLNGQTQVQTNGIHFQRAERGKEGRMKRSLAPYKKELLVAIEQYLIPRRLKIEQTLDKTSASYVQGLTHFTRFQRDHYTGTMFEALVEDLPRKPQSERAEFLNLLKSRGSKVLKIFMEGLGIQEADRIAEILNPQGKPPLYDLASGTELNSGAQLDARRLLEHLFVSEGFLEGVDRVLFTDAGLYYYKEDEINFIEATDKFEEFFGKHLNNEINKRKALFSKAAHYTGRRELPGFQIDFRNQAQSSILAVVEESLEAKLDPRYFSEVEKMMATAERELGFELSFHNVSSIQALREPKNRAATLHLLKTIKCLRPVKVKVELRTNLDGEVQVDPSLEDKKVAARHLMDRFDLLISPSFWKEPYSVKARVNFDFLEVNDLIMFESLGEDFVPFFIRKMLVSIFIHFIFVESGQESQAYKHFKALIGNRKINNGRRKLAHNGFIPSSEAAERAILVQYFMNLGAMYVGEANSGIKNKELPDEFREFFRKHVSKEKVQLGR